MLEPAIADRLTRNEAGLIPAIIQQHDTREVLMLGWMDDEALDRTLAEGRVTFWSRSRGEYWRKGDTSGNIQLVRSVALDCDCDALLVGVEQIGPACHTGTQTCFTGRELPVAIGHQDALGPDQGVRGPDQPHSAPAQLAPAPDQLAQPPIQPAASSDRSDNSAGPQ